MPLISYLKKTWKNKSDSSLVEGVDPALQASELNRIETGINDTVTEINAHEADTTAAHPASAISILDTGNHYTSTDVEAALAEVLTLAGGSGSFAGGTITGPTTVDTGQKNANQFSIIQPDFSDGTGYAMLVYGPASQVGGPAHNTERRWFMLHHEGGMCLSAWGEPDWAILHLYKWGAAQSKPILRITDELTSPPGLPNDLVIIDQNGGLVMTPIQNFVDPVRIYDFNGNLIFEIKRDGEVVGAPPIVDAMVLLNPKASVGAWNRNVAGLFRFPYYVWNGNPTDHIDFDVGLFAGSWYLDAYLVGGNDQGRAIVTLNGTTLGTIDAYNVGATPVDVVQTLGPFTVAAAGRKTLSFATTTKNPSSAAANFALRHAVFRRA
jgi:hypothetical protein